MPQAWRVLSVIVRVTTSWDDPFTLKELMNCYEVRIKSKNRLAFHVRAKRNALVEGVQATEAGRTDISSSKNYVSRI